MSTQKFRINMFEQFSAFYEHIWFAEFQFKQNHVSLYMFLLNQNNRSNWAPWFNLPLDLGQKGSCISSNKTYYKTLKELQEQDLIIYEKGANEWRAPRVQIKVLQRGKNTLLPTSLLPLKGESSYPSSGNLVTPLVVGDIDSKTEDNKTDEGQTSFLQDENKSYELINHETNPKRFPKGLQMVLDYCFIDRKAYTFDAWAFFETFTDNQWCYPPTKPIKDWKGQMRTWISKNYKPINTSHQTLVSEYIQSIRGVKDPELVNKTRIGLINAQRKGSK